MLRANETLQQVWIFAGFRQVEGTVTNGMVRLAESLHAALDCRTNRVLPRAYNDSPRAAAAHAEHVRQAHGIDERQLAINVVGYSYGGDTAVRFCRALEQVGLAASNLVLCDPVKRFRPYTILARPLRRFVDRCGLTPRLEVPRSVGSVQVFAQDQRRPWPANVLQADAEVRPVYLPYDHTAMDNAPEFKDAVLRLVKSRRELERFV